MKFCHFFTLTCTLSILLSACSKTKDPTLAETWQKIIEIDHFNDKKPPVCYVKKSTNNGDIFVQWDRKDSVFYLAIDKPKDLLDRIETFRNEKINECLKYTSNPPGTTCESLYPANFQTISEEIQFRVDAGKIYEATSDGRRFWLGADDKQLIQDIANGNVLYIKSTTSTSWSSRNNRTNNTSYELSPRQVQEEANPYLFNISIGDFGKAMEYAKKECTGV